MRLKSLVCLICILALQITATAAVAKTITDSKVVDLPCDRLSDINIFEYLREDFDHRENHFPVANWGFRAGFHEIAGCWSLSRNQRLSFYLAGYDHIEAGQAVVQDSLNMFRRWTPRLSRQGHLMFSDTREFHLMPRIQSVYQQLNRGFEQKLTNGRHSEVVKRNFRTDIETYQIHRFHSLGKNNEYLKGRRERSPSVNETSARELVDLLDRRALPMVNIRAALAKQHILLVKDYLWTPDGRLEFRVYDSNRPFQDDFFYFDTQSRHFSAPSILRTIGDQKPDHPVGVFVVDNDELELIHARLRLHYSQICKSLETN